MKNTLKPEVLCTAEQREKMLEEMRKVSDAFYAAAFRIGCHPFLEFCGLMNEYIQICQAAQKQDIDFTNTTAHSGYGLPMQVFHAAYLGEKIGCIYGPALRDPVIGRAFLEAVGLPLPRGFDATEPDLGAEP